MSWRTVYKVRFIAAFVLHTAGHTIAVGDEVWATKEARPAGQQGHVYRTEINGHPCVFLDTEVEELHSAVEHPNGGGADGHIEFDYMVDQEIPLEAR